MINQKLPLSILGLCVVFVLYAWSATPAPTTAPVGMRFDWPDETANFFWVQHFADSSSLLQAEPLNVVAANHIHPRSFNVAADGALVPGSFLGLIILYGTIAKVIGAFGTIYITPLLSVAGIAAFYYIVRHIFSVRVAVLSAVLLAIHPAWWYYSATSMLPNVAYVALVLVSVALLVVSRRVHVARFASAAVAAGMAVAIRPAELGWTVLVFVAVWFWQSRHYRAWHVVVFAAVVLALNAPLLFFQNQLYGGYLTTGYVPLQQSSLEVCTSCSIAKSFIAPFGIHPALALKNLWLHYVSNFWWLTLVTVLGFVAFVVRQKTDHRHVQYGYMALGLAVLGWLALYYGSWQFTDLLTLSLNTLGISYVRYWLPLYILGLPFTAFGILFLSSLVKNRWRTLAQVFLVALLLYASARTVLFEKQDSLLPVRQRIVSYKEVSAQVNSLVEDNAVIVTVRKDKVFFPDRRVIHTFDALSKNNEVQSVLPALLAEVPVYYYALGPEPTQTLEYGLGIEVVQRIGQEVLYRVYEL